MRSVCKIDQRYNEKIKISINQYINKNMGKIIIIILLLILAAIILAPIGYLIKYKYVAPNQKKMFNQLVKGDYLWCVDEDGVTHYTIYKIGYDFNRNTNTVRTIKIYYYTDYNYIQITPEAAKSFKFGKWYTIKAAAELDYKNQENKRNEAILGVTSCTTEEIKKASEKLIKQLESTN